MAVVMMMRVVDPDDHDPSSVLETRRAVQPYGASRAIMTSVALITASAG